MPRSNQKRIKKSLDPRKIIADRILSKIRIGGVMRTTALFSLKTNYSAIEMQYFLKNSLKDRNVLNTFHGHPFPGSVNGLFSIPASGQPARLASELAWGLYRFSLFKDELNEFSELRMLFERAVLLDHREEAWSLLEKIEDSFGISIWLIQNRLSLTQVWNGLEEKRKLANEILSKCQSNTIPRFLINFISKRSEATGLKNYLQDELGRYFQDSDDSYFEGYIRTKLFELGQYSTSNMAATLFFEAQSSIIDHYETLVLLLQSIVVDDDLPDDASDFIFKFLKNNLPINDYRLTSIQRTLSPQLNLSIHNFGSRRSEIIEHYSSAKYQDVLNSAPEYLKENPEDISICSILAKSAIAIDEEIPSLPGYLGEILRLFVKLYAFSKETYGAAFAIYTIHDRFYGHYWAVMARAIMNDALARESINFPTKAQKYALSMEKHTSPFVALSLRKSLSQDFLNNSEVNSTYPYTSDVLRALLTGKHHNKITGTRLNRYLARHNLAAGNNITAAHQFSALMEEGTAAERFRAAACAAHAYLALRDLPSAVDAVVTGSLINKEVPIILPIPDVVGQLDSVQSWPDSISLPILFELYSTYFGDDKLAHLKFSFERFQLANEISQPDDIQKLIESLGLQKIVTYLDRVWRPEIMRQTLLYETPKETEDARIAVCRVLASIDQKNAQRYQEEIRDRVKRQEIAKGTTLVEQSKVYVDISAIKKALNTRLGDTYTRYKSATQANPNQQDNLMGELADKISSQITSHHDVSLTNILSTLHVLDYKESELDLQFSALFSEVTNEFLKGDHGLNAYLSTRVRHGTLANTLRKPLADEHLVTALKEDESGYLANTSWDADLDSLRSDEKQTILDSLEKFTKKIDGIIDYVKNNLIQIRVFQDIQSPSEKDEALFIYRSSNLERKYVQEFDKKVTNIEQFIDRCIESLWEKTDYNLSMVRNVLRDRIRSDFLQCFDDLTDKVQALSNQSSVIGLSNAIVRARTNFQTKFNVVQSWFNRNEVYDRQDYLPDYAVQIALNMVQKTIPSGNHDLQVNINFDNSGDLMPGRSLDAMVDVFACLLDNATIRSGLTTDKLKISVDLKLLDGSFEAVVTNNTAPDKPSIIDTEKVNLVRESLTKSDSRARAQREGGSGFHKIWRAITSPIYKEPYFWFDFEENSDFKVIIRYKLDKAENENTSN